MLLTRQEFGDLNFRTDIIFFFFLVWILTQGSGLPQMGHFYWQIFLALWFGFFVFPF